MSTPSGPAWSSWLLVAACVLAGCGEAGTPVAAPPVAPPAEEAPGHAPEQAAAPQDDRPNELAGHEQMANAQTAGRFFVGLFSDAAHSPSPDQRAAFERAAAAAGDRATFAPIRLDAPEHKKLGVALDLARTPLPAIVAVAPGGAVTQTLVTTWDEADIAKAFVGPGLQSALAHLQQGKVVVAVVQTQDAQDKTEALAGSDALFDADDETHTGDRAKLGRVRVDPRDALEQDFCARFEIDPADRRSTTLVLAPPDKVLGRLVGKTTVDELLEITRRYKAP